MLKILKSELMAGPVRHSCKTKEVRYGVVRTCIGSDVRALLDLPDHDEQTAD